jgi:mRNA interferase MazF
MSSSTGPEAGQVILLHFPQSDLTIGKLRPALIIEELPGSFNDWLICMISSQVHHHIADFDEIISMSDQDFPDSGLKSTGLIRTGRMAVVEGEMLLGFIGQISDSRLLRIKNNLSNWLNTQQTDQLGSLENQENDKS